MRRRAGTPPSCRSRSQHYISLAWSLPDYGLTASTLAVTLGVSRQTINELLRERRAVSPAMALRLSRLFGNSAEFWLNAQQAVDLWQAEKELAKDLARIQTLQAA